MLLVEQLEMYTFLEECSGEGFSRGLDSRRPAIAPLFTRKHRVTRLRFTSEHVNKRNLNTSNECKQIDKIWRRPEGRFVACNISPRFPFFGGSIMFKGGIGFDGRTDLIPIWKR